MSNSRARKRSLLWEELDSSRNITARTDKSVSEDESDDGTGSGTVRTASARTTTSTTTGSNVVRPTTLLHTTTDSDSNTRPDGRNTSSISSLSQADNDMRSLVSVGHSSGSDSELAELLGNGTRHLHSMGPASESSCSTTTQTKSDDVDSSNVVDDAAEHSVRHLPVHREGSLSIVSHDSSNVQQNQLENNQRIAIDDSQPMADPGVEMGTQQQDPDDAGQYTFLGPEADVVSSYQSPQDEASGSSELSSTETMDTSHPELLRNEGQEQPSADKESLPNMDELLFPGSQLTKKESLLLIMSHFLRYGLSQEALESLLQLIQFHLPEETPFKISKYIFNKEFDGLCDSLEYHIYCPSCQGYVGTSSAACVDCEVFVEYEDNMKSGNYFIVFSIEKQLRDMFQNPNIQSKLHTENSGMEQSACYKQLPLQEGDVTYTWGTDGASIFSSSNYSIWPLQLMINELPYAIRRKHILLGGLWFGADKPNFASFLKPIVEEMNNLSSVGFAWNKDGTEMTTRAFPAALACDSVARCQLQGIKQFNGKFGCSWCLHPGERVAKGNGYTNAYPVRDLDNLPPKREERSFQNDAQRAVESNAPVNGVKGPSMILLLMHFNIISGFAVDYMHSVCLGVCRTLTFLWLEATDMPCYIGGQTRVLNERLSKLRPPSDIVRLTRSLTKRSYWKAHEWRVWLLHYSPFVLRNVLPRSFYNHWMCLVTSLFILLQSDIDAVMVNQVELILAQFVLEFEELYGKEYMTYNVHQLVHLADTVRNWGPLWGTSCFAFESMNHKLNKMICGTQYVQHQIARKFLLLKTLPHVYVNCFEGNDTMRIFYERNVNYFPSSTPVRVDFSGQSLRGKPQLVHLNDMEMHFLEQVGYQKPHALAYKKMSVGGITITTDQRQQKRRKRVDCFVCLVDGSIGVVRRIFLLCKACNAADMCECEKECMLYLSILKEVRQHFFSVETPDYEVGHLGLQKIIGHKEYRLVSLNEFHRKCVHFSIGEDEFVSVLPNRVELD